MSGFPKCHINVADGELSHNLASRYLPMLPFLFYSLCPWESLLFRFDRGKKKEASAAEKVEKWWASQKGISKGARNFHKECPESGGITTLRTTENEPVQWDTACWRLWGAHLSFQRRTTKCRYQFISEIKRAAIIVKQWARERNRASQLLSEESLLPNL